MVFYIVTISTLLLHVAVCTEAALLLIPADSVPPVNPPHSPTKIKITNYKMVKMSDYKKSNNILFCLFFRDDQDWIIQRVKLLGADTKLFLADSADQRLGIFRGNLLLNKSAFEQLLSFLKKYPPCFSTKKNKQTKTPTSFHCRSDIVLVLEEPEVPPYLDKTIKPYARIKTNYSELRADQE